MMNLSSVDISIIGIYFFVLVIYSIYFRFRKIKFSDFSVAGRSVSTLLISLSLLSTLIGPAYSLALADKGYESGYLYLFIFSFFSVQFILSGFYFAPKLQSHTDCHSVGDVLFKAYGKPMQYIVGIVSLLLTIAFTAIMAKVGGSILSDILGISFLSGVIIITAVGVVYTVSGGLKAVIFTEVFQAILIFGSTSLLLLMMLMSDNVPDSWLNIAMKDTTHAFNEIKPINLVGLALAFLLGELLIPPYSNRAFASRSQDIASKGFIVSGIASFFWFVMVVTIGILSVYFIGTSNGGGVLINTGVAVLPSGLLGLFVIALAAIVMSTQESLLNAGATSFIRDIMSRNQQDSGRDLLAVRIVTLSIATAAVFIALYAPSILSILLAGYAVWVPIVAVPLAWYLIFNKPDFKGIYIYPAVILGGSLSIGSMIYDSAAIEDGTAVFAGVLGNFAGLLVGIALKK